METLSRPRHSGFGQVADSQLFQHQSRPDLSDGTIVQESSNSHADATTGEWASQWPCESKLQEWDSQTSQDQQHDRRSYLRHRRPLQEPCRRNDYDAHLPQDDRILDTCAQLYLPGKLEEVSPPWVKPMASWTPVDGQVETPPQTPLKRETQDNATGRLFQRYDICTPTAPLHAKADLRGPPTEKEFAGDVAQRLRRESPAQLRRGIARSPGMARERFSGPPPPQPQPLRRGSSCSSRRSVEQPGSSRAGWLERGSEQSWFETEAAASSSGLVSSSFAPEQAESLVGTPRKHSGAQRSVETPQKHSQPTRLRAANYRPAEPTWTSSSSNLGHASDRARRCRSAAPRLDTHLSAAREELEEACAEFRETAAEVRRRERWLQRLERLSAEEQEAALAEMMSLHHKGAARQSRPRSLTKSGVRCMVVGLPQPAAPAARHRGEGVSTAAARASSAGDLADEEYRRSERRIRREIRLERRLRKRAEEEAKTAAWRTTLLVIVSLGAFAAMIAAIAAALAAIR